MATKYLGALVAGGLGVTSAVTAATVVQRSFPAPKFSMQAERFDQSTFQGRFSSMLSKCNPSLLIASDAAIRQAEALLKGPLGPELSNDDLWDARLLVESAVHPDTGEIVPKPFRMSGYVPFNGPICVAVMMSTSIPTLLFWNWVNQSQNALVNYFNRNASSPTSNETLAISYSAAVGAALTMAFGLSQIIQRRFSPDRARQLLKFVAFPSSVVASSSNCYIMRSPEIQTGVELLDKDMKVVAQGRRSNVAAEKAVMETVYSRALLQIPVFLIPAVFMSLPPIVAVTASASVAIPLSTLVTMIAFGLGLPAATAVFPQYGNMDTADLEDQFRSLTDDQGQPIKTVWYNKGL